MVRYFSLLGVLAVTAVTLSGCSRSNYAQDFKEAQKQRIESNQQRQRIALAGSTGDESILRAEDREQYEKTMAWWKQERQRQEQVKRQQTGVMEAQQRQQLAVRQRQQAEAEREYDRLLRQFLRDKGEDRAAAIVRVRRKTVETLQAPFTQKAVDDFRRGLTATENALFENMFIRYPETFGELLSEFDDRIKQQTNADAAAMRKLQGQILLNQPSPLGGNQPDPIELLLEQWPANQRKQRLRTNFWPTQNGGYSCVTR